MYQVTNAWRDGRLLIVGNPDPIHVGDHLRQAALGMDLEVKICDTRRAYAAPALILRLNWHLRNHHPPHLDRFSAEVVRECKLFRPRWLVATGIVPLTAAALLDIGKTGVTRLNFLTDDPWNPQHYADWFMRALPHYDHVFSPRRANLDDLMRANVPQVSYLPFAYAPEIHFSDPPKTPEEREWYDCDVLFFGGADDDRLPFIDGLVDAGINVHLYGGYWERISRMRFHHKGHVGPEILRRAVGGAKVTLCLVRRANRDGHVMRTFEVPAMGACMLAEYTEEHVEILGPDGGAVVYFRSDAELVDRTRRLLAQPQEREKLKARLKDRIVLGPNTYRDRLATMLNLVNGPAVSASHVEKGN